MLKKGWSSVVSGAAGLVESQPAPLATAQSMWCRRVATTAACSVPDPPHSSWPSRVARHGIVRVEKSFRSPCIPSAFGSSGVLAVAVYVTSKFRTTGISGLLNLRDTGPPLPLTAHNILCVCSTRCRKSRTRAICAAGPASAPWRRTTRAPCACSCCRTRAPSSSPGALTPSPSRRCACYMSAAEALFIDSDYVMLCRSEEGVLEIPR